MNAIRRNLVFGALGIGINTIGGIALVPMFLHAWGPELYGQWLVLLAVPSTLALFELGMNGAFANSYVIALESGEDEKSSDLASTVWKAELCILCIALSALLCILLAFPFAEWLGVTAIPRERLLWCVALLAINAASGVLCGFFAAFFRAVDRNSTLVASCTFFKSLELAATAAVLASGVGVVALCTALAASKLVQLGWTAHRARSLAPHIRLFNRPFSREEFIRLLPSGLGFLGYSLGNALVNQGAVIGVQKLLGPAAVAQLSVGRQLGRLFLQAINLVFSSLHPEMNLAFARGDLRRVVMLQAMALFPLIWLSPLILAGTALYGPQVIGIWTDGAVDVPSSLAVVLTAESLSYGVSTVALLTAWSSNRHARASFWFVLIQVVSLAAGLWCIPFAGISAIGLAFVVANLAQTVLALQLTAQISETRAWALAREAVVSDPWGVISGKSTNS